MLINQSDIRSFNEDGVVILRGVFSEWIETLLKGAERHIENPSERALTHHHEKYKGQFLEEVSLVAKKKIMLIIPLFELVYKKTIDINIFSLI